MRKKRSPPRTNWEKEKKSSSARTQFLFEGLDPVPVFRCQGLESNPFGPLLARLPFQVPLAQPPSYRILSHSRDQSVCHTVDMASQAEKAAIAEDRHGAKSRLPSSYVVDLSVESFDKDLAAAIVPEGHAQEFDSYTERRVLRKIDLYLIPCMWLGYGFVYYDKVASHFSVVSLSALLQFRIIHFYQN